MNIIQRLLGRSIAGWRKLEAESNRVRLQVQCVYDEVRRLAELSEAARVEFLRNPTPETLLAAANARAAHEAARQIADANAVTLSGLPNTVLDSADGRRALMGALEELNENLRNKAADILRHEHVVAAEVGVEPGQPNAVRRLLDQAERIDAILGELRGGSAQPSTHAGLLRQAEA